MPRSEIPLARIRKLNSQPIQADAAYVLYWMTAFRRPFYNFSLDRACEFALRLERPLLIFEALRVGYRWASERLHRFVLDGMMANHEAFSARHIVYYSYIEPHRNAANGLLATLAERACVVITDDFPCFFLPRMIDSVGRSLAVHCEAVDSNGLLPLRSTPRAFEKAYSFRRHLQREIGPHLAELPQADPCSQSELPRTTVVLPPSIMERWPELQISSNVTERVPLARLPIDHTILPVPYSGGWAVARKQLSQFLRHRLSRYAEDHSHPDLNAASELSPWLHFGHISAHEIWVELIASEEWSAASVLPQALGSRRGFWGMSAGAEDFIDELVTWRELGFTMCHHRTDYDQFSSLPGWAQQTLMQHARDAREHIYTLSEFEHAGTHDPVWNAAQCQLVSDGRIHNYLRMLWGKKILEWSATPEDALHVMIELNNKYAVDGRNPNSYSGIFWVLGRYDRPWGPERPVFGKIRYMSSANTVRKLQMGDYLHRFTPRETEALTLTLTPALGRTRLRRPRDAGLE